MTASAPQANGAPDVSAAVSGQNNAKKLHAVSRDFRSEHYSL